MPNLARLVEGGAMGNLHSLQPMLSPVLWTSIATGRRAFDHGVRGFVEPLPDRSGVRPVGTRSRRCPALWNLVSRAGGRSVVCGWQASHPAEPIDGAFVSNAFAVPPVGATPAGIEHGLRAVGLRHEFPEAHFQLGAILARLGWFERAAQAFEITLRLRPGFVWAHRYLARIYARQGRPEAAQRHRQEARAVAGNQRATASGGLRPHKPVCQSSRRGELAKHIYPDIMAATIIGPLFCRRWFSRESIDQAFTNLLIRRATEKT